MARITCTITEVEIENDNGRLVDGVEATCSQCRNTGQAYGTHDGSRTRALMVMKESCPRKGAKNFYVEG